MLIKYLMHVRLSLRARASASDKWLVVIIKEVVDLERLAGFDGIAGSNGGIGTFCGCWFLFALSPVTSFLVLCAPQPLCWAFLCASLTETPSPPWPWEDCAWAAPKSVIYWKSQLWARQFQWSTAAVVTQLELDWTHCAQPHKYWATPRSQGDHYRFKWTHAKKAFLLTKARFLRSPETPYSVGWKSCSSSDANQF